MKYNSIQNQKDNGKSLLESEAGVDMELKPYVRPMLTRMKHLRDITLAPTEGTFESGFGNSFRGPGDTESGAAPSSADPADPGFSR